MGHWACLFPNEADSCRIIQLFYVRAVLDIGQETHAMTITGYATDDMASHSRIREYPPKFYNKSGCSIPSSTQLLTSI
jgi:hypothetical protein